MKKRSIIGLVLSLCLAACTPYIYGVPQDSWDRMSGPERQRVMAAYEREEQARRQAEAEQARRQAFERERERARQAAVERARQERIEAIHRGEGAYGELLRVRLQGGHIRVGDRHHRYEPITFTIADGETLQIGVADRKGRETGLLVTYAGGALSFDGISFPYDRSWRRGRLYADTGTSGALKMGGVDVFIEIHRRSARHERDVPRLTIIREVAPPPVRDRDSVRPSPVAVPEKEKPKPPSVVMTEKQKPGPPRRQPEPPAVERPPQALEVVLLSGEMKVRGRNQSVERVTVRLAEGETGELVVKAGGEAAALSLRYRNGVLTINDTPGKRRDAVRLPFERGWSSGKVYRFDLKEKVHLENIEVSVTGIRGK